MKLLSRTGIVAAALFVLAACANTVFKPSAEGLIAEAEQTVIILKGRADLAQGGGPDGTRAADALKTIEANLAALTP